MGLIKGEIGIIFRYPYIEAWIWCNGDKQHARNRADGKSDCQSPHWWMLAWCLLDEWGDAA